MLRLTPCMTSMRYEASPIEARAYLEKRSALGDPGSDQLGDGGAQLPLGHLAADLHLSGGAQQDKRGRPGESLLVVRDGPHDLLDLHTLKRHRQPMRNQQLTHLGAQLLAAREAQGGEQTEADGLAVAVAGVAGGGLDRVADGVPEVEDLAAAGGALVLGDDGELRARAFEDRALVRGPRPRSRRDATP